MVALPTLYPTSQSAAGGWTDEAGAASNLHLVIDETGAAGTDYIRGPLNAATTVGKFGLTDTPADFGSMTSLSYTVRSSRGGAEAGETNGNDTHTLFIQVFKSDGTTALTNEMTVKSLNAGWLAADFSGAFTGVVAANKTDWDGALVAIRTTFSQSGGADGDRVWVDFVRLDSGVYVSSAIVKLRAESLEHAEGALRPRVLVRLRAETAEHSESVLRLRGRLKLAGETTEVVESVLSVRGLLHLDSGSLQLEEAALSVRGRLKQHAETAEATEADLHLRALARLLGETAEASEAEQHLRALARIAGETEQVAESALRPRALARLYADTAQLAEATIDARGLVRLLGEAEELSEPGALRLSALVRQVAESLEQAEGVLTTLALVRQVAEAAQLVELDLHLLAGGAGSIVRVQAETAELDEVLQRLRGRLRLEGAALSLVEGGLQLRALVRGYDDTLSAAELTQWVRGRLRLQAETTEPAESDLHLLVLTGADLAVEGETLAAGEVVVLVVGPVPWVEYSSESQATDTLAVAHELTEPDLVEGTGLARPERVGDADATDQYEGDV